MSYRATFAGLDILELWDHRIPHNFLTVEEFEDENKRHRIAMVLAQYCVKVRMEERDETMDKYRAWDYPPIIYPNTPENRKMLGITAEDHNE